MPHHRQLLALFAAALLAACGTAEDPEPAAAEPARLAWPPAGREMPAELDSGRFVLAVDVGEDAQLHLLTDTGGGLAVRQGAVERVGGNVEEGAYLPELGDGVPPLPRGLHVSPDGQVPPFLPDGIVGAP
ncbi:MAG TPA: hypothetical protein VKU40_19725, partial [Thermoanaerobaculia bacterium]|nr:hypothetical protein [Thermoanaerobaculia bacterium]